ncbi:hypothetical protein PAXRUDRAFT_533799 [Paxillus rubicundulus Ve08.2h10]|uniref:Unplaced genomic scaffold scaffold_3901, whole genome shotgun sequence n=1 Tax=Paxillus rubicundulus Ve08.2h10 TaxID=930991 RepID=A0A0D0BT31_9AGAM|nr:hypothetical protein PAXRUDRAFT_533799 [Paxillus rubicundulus Ve08.2h10]
MCTNTTIPLQTIRIAFEELGRRVTIALRTQIGDTARLGEHRRERLRFSALVSRHTEIISSDERHTIETSIQEMVNCLGCRISSLIRSPRWSCSSHDHNIHRPTRTVAPSQSRRHALNTRLHWTEKESCMGAHPTFFLFRKWLWVNHKDSLVDAEIYFLSVLFLLRFMSIFFVQYGPSYPHHTIPFRTSRFLTSCISTFNFRKCQFQRCLQLITHLHDALSHIPPAHPCSP